MKGVNGRVNKCVACGLVALALAAVVLGGGGCKREELARIEIIHTADEHGWLNPASSRRTGLTQGGAANIYGWWTQVEGYDPESFLLLSGGDNWTGPSLCTFFEGKPMVEAFNLMGYDAASIGNHEFDFGREVLDDRISQADYPYLAANIIDEESGEIAAFARSYVIREIDGVRVGILGLGLAETPAVTHPSVVAGLRFAEYAETVREYVPLMREEGAEVVIILAHVCMDELEELARGLGFPVAVMFGGHCHELEVREVEGTLLVSSGWAWRSYSRVTLIYDRETAEVVESSSRQVMVEYASDGENPVKPDAAVQALVDRWRALSDTVLAQEIGYTVTGIEYRSPALANWVTDAWLWAVPSADAAVTNTGGLRQGIPPGVVTIGDVMSVLPFDNTIYDVAITGRELAENLARHGGVVGGIAYQREGEEGEEVEITFLDGRPFDPDDVYHVLINSFMYAGGDGYLFGKQDPEGYDTGIQWRQPVIDWTRSLRTSSEDPLERRLDDTERGPW